MKLVIGGVRGSFPVSGAEVAEFGGDTTSFLIEHGEGAAVVVDLGTGAKRLGERLMQRHPRGGRVLVCLSHYHLDHLCGLAMFGPLSSPDWQVEFAGPDLEAGDVRSGLEGLFRPPYWPLQLKDYPCRMAFHRLERMGGGPGRSWDGFTVRWCPVGHPGGGLAYRIEDERARCGVAVASDIEWGMMSGTERERFLHFLREPGRVEVLIMDGHFRDEEIEKHQGWGHSSVGECIAVAQASRVGQLILGHHAPKASDAELRGREAELQQTMPWASLGRAGQVVDVGPSQGQQ
ncbi:MAG TPA: MBL fold metallo-hydrolase [Kiritimatiellia bacterium]|nr:MBL fold metallo-hydrolase [Kiritimatiellia bacterium]